MYQQRYQHARVEKYDAIYFFWMVIFSYFVSNKFKNQKPWQKK